MLDAVFEKASPTFTALQFTVYFYYYYSVCCQRNGLFCHFASWYGEFLGWAFEARPNMLKKTFVVFVFLMCRMIWWVFFNL